MLVRLAFLCVLQLTLNSNVFAQDIVTDCDKYAASETDPNAKAPGVLLERVNAALAVRSWLRCGNLRTTRDSFSSSVVRIKQTISSIWPWSTSARLPRRTTRLRRRVLVTCHNGSSPRWSRRPPDDQQAATGIVGPLSKDCRQRKQLAALAGVTQNAGTANSAAAAAVISTAAPTAPIGHRLVKGCYGCVRQRRLRHCLATFSSAC